MYRRVSPCITVYHPCTAVHHPVSPCITPLYHPRQAVRGGVGEKSLRNVLELAERVADRVAPQDREAIHKMAGDVGAMADALCELRQNGQVRPPSPTKRTGEAANSDKTDR